jgi:uncharacterized protein (UPF0216 family)
MEYRKLNQNTVANPIRLEELLKMPKPAAVTRGGEEYLFDTDTLHRFSEKVPTDLYKRLRLPIIFFTDTRIADSCYLADKHAFEALTKSGDLNPLYRLRDGKLWLSKPLAFDLANKYPTLVQFVVH